MLAKQNLDSIINKAAEFHGHIGPFLVVGVRMGLIGLRELETTPDNAKLRSTISVEQVVPFSCVIDGIQVVTKCTIGNRKLQLKKASKTISTDFQILGGRHVTVTLKPGKLMELKNALPTNISSRETIKLARLVATLPEEELFTILRK
jgi:formylmethanofuran dehydrogenase subunit E